MALAPLLAPLFSDLPQIEAALPQIETALPQMDTALPQIKTVLPQIEILSSKVENKYQPNEGLIVTIYLLWYDYHTEVVIYRS